jgi:crossover junction endodeoxyribonuclease RusA
MKTKKKKKETLLDIAIKNNDLVRVKPAHPKKKLKITLPPCPSINHAYKTVRGKRFMTKDALMFMQTAHQIVEREKVKQKYELEKQGVWLIVEVTYYFHNRLRRDCHNQHKILADALNGSAYIDDQFVLIRDKEVLYDKDNPRLEVEIYPAKFREVETNE